ncbi:MAG: BlaI/MecI/CopY family transcriptional regulator [Lachnospiraceae bacterium]|nr:BlaI/MecI/CopY family transcriptional regulator [Lachnospiraceae bacterium]
MANYGLLTETEFEVLSKMWDLDTKVTAKDLLAIFNEQGKDWKLPTVNTFLSHLLNAGYLKAGLGKRAYVYWPSMSRAAFEQKNAQYYLDKMFGGSCLNFITALSGGAPLPQNQADELNDWILKHR